MWRCVGVGAVLVGGVYAAGLLMVNLVPATSIPLLVALWYAANLFDGLTTWRAVTRFGNRGEGNPLLRRCIEAHGVLPALLLVKGFGSSIVLIVFGPMFDDALVRSTLFSASLLLVGCGILTCWCYTRAAWAR